MFPSSGGTGVLDWRHPQAVKGCKLNINPKTYWTMERGVSGSGKLLGSFGINRPSGPPLTN